MLDEMSQVALDALVDARTKHSQLKTELTQAREADDAMRRLETLFRQEATLTVALQATEATRDELLEETVRPLATELNQRWKALFPTRGDLRTTANGAITRSINGYELPFDAFSTAESMGAAIIIRLLAAQMATGRTSAGSTSRSSTSIRRSADASRTYSPARPVGRDRSGR